MNRKQLWKDSKIIFVLAFPIIIENTLQKLLGTTDTYFAGKLGDYTIAGICVTNLVVNIFISFFMAISIGSTAIVSWNYGKKDYKKVNSSIKHSCAIGLVLGIFVGIIGFVFAKPILSLSGANIEIIAYALPYYYVVIVPSVFICLQLVLSSCLRAIKDTKTPMYSTGLAVVLNIVLNYTFIKMNLGVVGLGLATTISRIMSVMLLALRMKRHDKKIQITFKNEKFNKETFKSILLIGIPAGIEKLIMRIGQLVYNGMIITLGTSVYVAHNIAGNIESYVYIPAMGFGLAVTTLVGVSLGEKKIDRAKKLTFMTYLITMSLMVVIGVGSYIFAPQLASLFTDTVEIQNMIVSVLRIIAFFQPFSALVQIITNALQGAGDTRFPMYSTFIGIWGIRIGIGYILAIVFQLGLNGVWLAYALDLVVRGLLLLYRFTKGKWASISI